MLNYSSLSMLIHFSSLAPLSDMSPVPNQCHEHIFEVIHDKIVTPNVGLRELYTEKLWVGLQTDCAMSPS